MSCIYGIGSVETYTAMTFSIKLGEKLDQRQLLRSGRAAIQAQRPDFSRGVSACAATLRKSFPAHYEDRAWRITFFGDEVELLAEFDPLTGKKMQDLELVKFYANSHYVTPRPTLLQAVGFPSRPSCV